jgi:hypothetical protein
MGAPSILAIDPGTTHSGWCRYQDGRVIESGVIENAAVVGLHYLRQDDDMAIEMVASYGMAVGAETFRTVWWAGRFAQQWVDRTGRLPMEIFRKDVKLHLCGTTKAKDTNIRHALIDRYGGEGGREAAVGRKATPGPLYGVVSHAWPALAVAITADETILRPLSKAA